VSTPVRLSAGFVILGVWVIGGVLLLHNGLYGMTLFILLPVLLGALSSWVFRPETAGRAAGLGVLTVTISTLALLMSGLEGMICIAMTLPLSIPLGTMGALGAWLMFRAEPSRAATRGSVAMLLLLPPASLTWDWQATPPVFEVRTAVSIAATPEQIWKHVVTFSDLPEPDEWFFRAGLAYPKRARIEGSGPGAIRYCEFSTGPFVEPIDVWNAPHLLQFRVTENPAPMHEWSPYAEVFPKHLHGYMVSKKGQFRLTRLSNNETLLEGTTWYQHGLWPAEYWRWWSDAIIHRIHLRVLNHIRVLAEAERL
jgi:hypothetical protein